MVDLGRSNVTPDILRLRSLCIDATNTLAQGIWPESILDDMPPGKQLDKIMLATQSTMRGTLNSVWAEKCRINAKNAVTEQVRRAKKSCSASSSTSHQSVTNRSRTAQGDC